MVTIELNEQQLQVLVGLLDAGVRSTGLQSVPNAAALLNIIEQAVQKAKQEVPENG